MDKPPRPEREADGAGRGWRPSAGYLAIALVLAVGGAGLLYLLATESDADPAAAPAPAPASKPATAWFAPLPAVAPRPASRAPEGDADPTRDLSSYVARGEKPSMAEVITRLHESGVYTGLGAFSPPGTRPPMVGLAVPEDFALPPGYVRHHQVTDDGQPIEAVLMFAPGFQLLDANQQPVDMPKDRLVPPELAPPGLPIRRIVIPAPIDPTRPGT